MVGRRLETVNKPSRSDEVADPEEQLQIAREVKARFESMAPKRAVKPNRSEPDPDASLAAHQPKSPQSIPELQKFLSLKSDHPLGGNGARRGEWMEQEEFVETDYYKQLESIDKQHHTTGTGFIKAAAKEGVEINGDDHEFPNYNNGGEIKMGAVGGYNYKRKSNPATNDWTPSANEIHHQVGYVSAKPSCSG